MSDNHFNKTFSSDGNTSLNACVGNNGWSDLNTYRKGYDEAVATMALAAINHQVHIDTIIYPLVFSARHSIELFLKHAIQAIGRSRKNLAVTDDKLIKTHNLHDLWELFKDSAEKFDRRLNSFITNSNEIVMDFSAIDLTAETFRYPYSQNDEKHLKKTPVINIGIFYTRYKELSDNFNKTSFILENLIDEYKKGTFTKNLSRNDINEISNRIPIKSEWESEPFIQEKNKIITEYNLSNRNFSEALNIIKNHREFSSNIGVEIPINYITPTKLDLFIKEWKTTQELISKIDHDYGMNPTTNKLELDFKALIHNNYTHEEIADLSTLLELGSLQYYSEDYEYLLKDFLNGNTEELIWRLITSRSIMQSFEESLSRLGQTRLENVMEKHS